MDDLTYSSNPALSTVDQEFFDADTRDYNELVGCIAGPRGKHTPLYVAYNIYRSPLDRSSSSYSPPDRVPARSTYRTLKSEFLNLVRLEFEYMRLID